MKSQRYDRSAVAREVISTLVPLVQSSLGGHVPGTGGVPDHSTLNIFDLDVVYVPYAHLDPVIGRSQGLLDVWCKGQGKVLSVAWEPLTIVGFKGGPWIEVVRDLSAGRCLQ